VDLICFLAEYHEIVHSSHQALYLIILTFLSVDNVISVTLIAH